MEYASGRTERVFLVRFDHGDDLLEEIKDLAEKENIRAASISLLGAVSRGDIVTGPVEEKIPPDPNKKSFSGGWETLGTGTITWKDDSPHVHLHTSFGKGTDTLTGCLREEGKVFVTVEAVVTEIAGINVTRKKDDSTRCDLLDFSS